MRAIWRVADPEELARVAAAELLRCMDEAVAREGRFSVALSGGQTPRGLYELLAKPGGGAGAPPAGPPRDWRRAFLFTVDERRVPPEHPESNFHLIARTLAGPLGIPAGNVARFLSESGDVGTAARVMEDRLRAHFPSGGDLPRFDLIVLGMGEDGHTASLFPGCDALEERRRLAAATWVGKLDDYRFTMTLPVLNAARRVLFLVSGASKAETLARVLLPPAGEPPLPAARVAPEHGELVWIVDREAASRIPAQL